MLEQAVNLRGFILFRSDSTYGDVFANRDLKTTLLAGGIVASFAAAVLAWLMSRTIVRPIVGMAEKCVSGFGRYHILFLRVAFA